LEQVKAERAAAGRAFTQEDLYQAIMRGAVERVRPKMMAVVAIMAGLLPIMWSTGTGSEIMQRIAVPMIGGMISSTILTLVVIPAILRSREEWGRPAHFFISKVPFGPLIKPEYLASAELLTPEWYKRYAELRGYASAK
jgi:predicted RND superfamily exporter protein